MKANEVPEKIYINDFGSELSYDWHTEHCCESDIEYTRTDGFIEKACEWLKEQDEMVGVSFQEDFLERFQNYMKGG